MTNEEKATSVLLNEAVRSLEDPGAVSDTTASAMNVWQGWARVPKMSELWEPRRERIEGVRNLGGDFHRVNIPYVLSSESALGM
jgi:hypothetical protein